VSEIKPSPTVRGLVPLVLADPVSVAGTAAGIIDGNLRWGGPRSHEGDWCCHVVTRGRRCPYLARFEDEFSPATTVTSRAGRWTRGGGICR